MDDLDTLSHEIAATSPDWAVAGVEAIADGGRIVRVCAVEGAVLHVIGNGSLTARVADCRPNLRDPVTVNALLGEGEVWKDGGGWLCNIADVRIIAATRRFAIGRAWIAAKGNGNGN